MMKSLYKKESSILINRSLLSVAVFISLGVLSLAFFFVYGNFVQDDAYITFRYARNLAHGLGFVYNPGEWVLGTTTPLFTILLAAGAWISNLDVVLISRFICFLSLWISSCILYKICEPNGKTLSLTVALLYLTSPFLPYLNGMESFFLLFLYLWAILAYQQNHLRMTAILSGLLILVRYEMIILMVLIGTVDLIKMRKLPFWLLPGLLPFIGWAIFAFIAFGSPIPLSASVKMTAPHIPFLKGFFFLWVSFLMDNISNAIVLLFMVFGIWKYIRSKNAYKNFNIIFLFSLIYLIVAAFIAGSFPWYYALLLPGISITAAIGLIDLSKLLTQSIVTRINGHKLFIGTLLSFTMILLMVIGPLQFWFSTYKQFQGQLYDNRYDPYQQVSDWLIMNATKDQSIATHEIGFLGYFTDMKIVDLFGLVSPELFPYLDTSTEETLYNIVPLFSPDFLLLPTKNIDDSIYQKTGLRYKFVKEFNNKYYLYQISTVETKFP
jgi:arabinofuranosyltransferase